MYIKLDRDYEVKCTLGTIKDIETSFQKPFFTLASALDKLTTDEQIRFLYAGVRRADPSVTRERFTDACEEMLGIGDLVEYLEKFVLQLQYPGLSQEEIREKIEKKLQAAERIRDLSGAKS